MELSYEELIYSKFNRQTVKLEVSKKRLANLVAWVNVYFRALELESEAFEDRIEVRKEKETIQSLLRKLEKQIPDNRYLKVVTNLTIAEFLALKSALWANHFLLESDLIKNSESQELMKILKFRVLMEQVCEQYLNDNEVETFRDYVNKQFAENTAAMNFFFLY